MSVVNDCLCFVICAQKNTMSEANWYLHMYGVTWYYHIQECQFIYPTPHEYNPQTISQTLWYNLIRSDFGGSVVNDLLCYVLFSHIHTLKRAKRYSKMYCVIWYRHAHKYVYIQHQTSITQEHLVKPHFMI